MPKPKKHPSPVGRKLDSVCQLLLAGNSRDDLRDPKPVINSSMTMPDQELEFPTLKTLHAITHPA